MENVKQFKRLEVEPTKEINLLRAEVKEYLEQLSDSVYSYHIDDDITDIRWTVLPSTQTLGIMIHNHEVMWNHFDQHTLWGFYSNGSDSPTPYDINDIERVAKAFSLALLKELGEDTFKVMRKESLENKDKSICVSHNYCDANMSMIEAFKVVLNYEPDWTWNMVCESNHLKLWNRAWGLAVEKGFYWVTSPSKPIDRRVIFDECYLETYFEVVAYITLRQEEGKTPKLIKLQELGGRCEIYNLAKELTDEFENKNKNRQWDGEFFDELDDYLTAFLYDKLS